jgi:hypothetical protein
MPISIPDSPSAETAPVGYTPSTPQAVEPAPQTFVLSTVTLSQTAQVLALQQQGQSPAEIAANLGIPVATVNSDLGIAVPVAAAALTPVQTAAPAQTGSANPAVSITA